MVELVLIVLSVLGFVGLVSAVVLAVGEATSDERARRIKR